MANNTEIKEALGAPYITKEDVITERASNLEELVGTIEEEGEQVFNQALFDEAVFRSMEWIWHNLSSVGYASNIFTSHITPEDDIPEDETEEQTMVRKQKEKDMRFYILKCFVERLTLYELYKRGSDGEMPEEVKSSYMQTTRDIEMAGKGQKSLALPREPNTNKYFPQVAEHEDTMPRDIRLQQGGGIF